METGDVILIADPDAEAREATASCLRAGGFRVVLATTGPEALDIARSTAPAAALLEIPLPGLSGYEVCRALKAELGRDLPVVFASGIRRESYDRVAGLLLGADDYLVKPLAPDELLARVRRLVDGARVPARAAVRLTPREHEVLRLLGGGLHQRDIAEHLVISPKTVSTHIENILRKLSVRSRAQAVAAAYRQRLLDVPVQDR
jgi:DNA-binding NarL/FixJ family response regulator